MPRFLALALAIHAARAAAASFYVSVSGNDSWSGTLPDPSPSRTDGPFLTLQRAQTAVQSATGPGTAVSVYVRAGIYALTTPLQLSHVDSGTASAPVTWAKYAADSGDAIIHGGVAVTGWTEDASGVWTASVPECVGAHTCTQLFVNGQRRVRARTPNVPVQTSPLHPSLLSRDGWYSDANTLHWAAPLSPCGTECFAACPSVDKLGFVYNSTDFPNTQPSQLANASVLVFQAWNADWATVGAVYPSNSTLMFTQPAPTAVGQFGSMGCPAGARYVLENYLDALDAPGEWFMDTNTGVLSYVPLPGETPDNVQAVVPMLASLVQVQGTNASLLVSYITFQGLTFSYTWEGADRLVQGTVEALLSIGNAAGITVTNCTLSHTGGHGIYIVGGVANLTVSDSVILDTGGDGIGTPWTAATSVTGTTISGCIVAGTGQIFMIQPTGIRLNGAADISAFQNEVFDSVYSGIAIGWQSGGAVPSGDATSYVFNVSLNLVHHFGQNALSDFGGIYTSALASDDCWANPDPQQHGCYIPTYISNNIVHTGRHYNYGSNGFYMDEAVSGVYIVSNIVYDVGNSGVYFHCGLNNTAVNNIFYAAAQEPHAQGLIGGCNTGGYTPRDNTSSINFFNNIAVVTAGALTDANDWYYTAHFDGNVYFAPANGSGTLIWPNGTSLSAWQASGEDVHVCVCDPQIADADAGNFTLAPTSPAWALGWQEIDTSRVGPQWT